MAAETHIARMQLMKINPTTGNPIGSGGNLADPSVKISSVLNFSTEFRMIVDSGVLNTASNPSIDSYLALEAASGFLIGHIDQYMIITVKPDSISISGTGSSVGASTQVNTAITADVNAAVAAASNLRLLGFAARETAGATASFKIIHGATVGGGTMLYPVNLTASQSMSEWFWPGLNAANGLSIDMISGTVDLDLFYGVII